MSKRAIFAQTEQIPWLDVAARLRDQYGWEICYFVGAKSQSRKAATLFPDTIFHTKNIARRNRGPQLCDRIPSAPLDESLLSALSYYESIYLKMMDRNDPPRTSL